VNDISAATVGWLVVSLIAGLAGAVLGMLVVRHNRRTAAERIGRQP
jgi:hypothetical protein